MSELQQWINSYLIKWGLVHDSANIWDNLVVLLLLIAITVGIDYTCRYIFLGLFKRFARKTKNQWDDLIVERKIINKLMASDPRDPSLYHASAGTSQRGNAYFTRYPSDGMQCLHCGRCTTIHQRFTELIIRDIQPERIDEEQTIERVCTNHSGDCVLCRWNNHYQYPDR